MLLIEPKFTILKISDSGFVEIVTTRVLVSAICNFLLSSIFDKCPDIQNF